MERGVEEVEVMKVTVTFTPRASRGVKSAKRKGELMIASSSGVQRQAAHLIRYHEHIMPQT
jgi:hypothetical protein